MNYVGKLLSASIEWLNLALHLVVIDDLKEIFLIFFTVKES